MPYNVRNWRVFHTDEEIKKFLKFIGDFSTSLIDQGAYIAVNDDPSYFKNSIGNHEIMKLKGNFIPKGIVPLEIFFLTMIPY